MGMLKRKDPKLICGIMPTQNQFKIVENLIREYSGEFNIKELGEHLPAGITYEEYVQIMNRFIEDRKITFDRNGVVGWIWNPTLVKKYLDDPSLTIIP